MTNAVVLDLSLCGRCLFGVASPSGWPPALGVPGYFVLALITIALAILILRPKTKPPTDPISTSRVLFGLALAFVAVVVLVQLLLRLTGAGVWTSSALGVFGLSLLFLMGLLAVLWILQQRADGPFKDTLLMLPIVGGLFIGLAALMFTPGLESYAWISVELMALGFFAIGVIIGFLFLVPRYADNSAGSGSSAITAQQSTGVALLPNTNLAKVSDWLTTAITAITLSQLKGIPGYIIRFGNYLQHSLPLHELGPYHYGNALAVALVAFFPALGFMAGCVATILYISPAMREKSIFGEATARQMTEASIAATTAAIVTKTAPGEPAPASPAVSESARIVAQDVTKVGLSELASPDDKITWANAQATLGNWAAAVRAYQEALAAKPNDPQLLESYANALLNAGAAPEEVIKEYERALPLVSDPTVKQRIYANLALCYLYIPEQYDRVLEYINKVIDDRSTQNDAVHYFYRACANGQKFAAAVKDANEKQLQDLHDAIVRDTRAALAIDPAIATRFQMVASPDFPDKDPRDNDLEIFGARYPDFQQLIGLKPPTPAPAEAKSPLPDAPDANAAEAKAPEPQAAEPKTPEAHSPDAPS
jgi:tetratricopeptide (TPR) repeat protein